MEEILKKTLDLVFSSKRPMPAHYTSNGDRKQSFCIDFELLTKTNDYNMASESFYSPSDYIEEMQKMIVDNTIETFNSEFNNLKEILFLDEVIKYFNHCADFGKMKGENKDQ